ncbi:hypothetical protein D3C86_1921480 [compost metagenome]
MQQKVTQQIKFFTREFNLFRFKYDQSFREVYLEHTNGLQLLGNAEFSAGNGLHPGLQL